MLAMISQRMAKELTQMAAPCGLTMMTAGLMLTPMGRIEAPLTATLITCHRNEHPFTLCTKRNIGCEDVAVSP